MVSSNVFVFVYVCVCVQPCLCFCACLRLWVSHNNTHVSVRLYNKVISRRRERVTHAQTQLALWTLKREWSKWRGCTVAGVEEWQGPRMCNHTHTHTHTHTHIHRQTAYCAGGEACLHSGTGRCWPAWPCETWKGCNASFSRNISSTCTVYIHLTETHLNTHITVTAATISWLID